MNEAKLFSQMMDDLAAELGMTLRFGEGGDKWIVPLADERIPVNVSYREKSGQVIVWALVHPLEDVDYREARARALLMTTAFCAGTRGFTLAVDPETHDLVAIGRRPARRIGDVSTLAHWLGDLGELVQDMRLVLTEADDAMDLGDGGEEVR